MLRGHDLRESLYAGDLVVLTQLPSVLGLVNHTRATLRELFAPHDPLHAHEFFSPEEMAKILGTWKPAFIHSAAASAFVKSIVAEAGFDPNVTHYDLPKPRTSFPQGHLTTGIAFAFPWHRDTWYAAPAQQLNWWLPIYEVSAKNAMSFDTAHFARSVPNDSGDFDYYQANAERFSVSTQIGTDRRVRPHAIDHRAETDTIILPAPGSVLLFSGANLHTSIPNTSGLARYSIDFRTVDAADVLSGHGAPMGDVTCTGTAIRDFVNVGTGEAFDENVVVDLYGPPPSGAMLVFDDDAAKLAVEAVSGPSD